jgi:hypothetical protein
MAIATTRLTGILNAVFFPWTIRRIAAGGAAPTTRSFREAREEGGCPIMTTSVPEDAGSD